MEQNSVAGGQVDSAETEKWKQEALAERQMYLRTLADFDNYRKRVQRERESAAAEGKKDVLLDLLEVVDGFHKAMEHLGEAPESIEQGFKALEGQISTVLKRHRITQVPSKGQPFDPAIHEPIDSVKADDYPSGTVVDELRPGYRLGNDLLRPARVRVAA